MVEEAFNQPFKTGPLIDQNGNYAVFDILLNKPMFDYILAHKLYSQKGQIEFNDPVVFPSGKNPGKDGPGRMGAIMLKVSWRVLANNDDRRRFHSARALIYMPGTKDGQVKPTCSGPKTLGLVGFHVAHKTVSRLQWIWTTFEHVDNAPEQKEVDDHIANAKNPLKAHYNFYNPTCNATKCPVNQTPPRPWGPDSSLKFHNPFRSQITRAISLFPDAAL